MGGSPPGLIGGAVRLVGAVRSCFTSAEVNISSTFALTRFTLDFCLGGHPSLKGNCRAVDGWAVW